MTVVRVRPVVIVVLLMLLGLLGALAPTRVGAATTDTVTTCNASGPGSLPVVFAAAMAGDTIVFAQDCTGGSAITLTGTLTPAVSSVTIDATVGGHAVTISGGGSVQLFRVNPSITLGLKGLTLTGGNSGNGGAIYTNGTVTISGCTFSGNTTTMDGSGGAISQQGGTLTVTNSTFSGNSALGLGNGGAIFHYSGTFTVTASTFSGNSAGQASGGIYINTGTLTLTLSIVAGNTASNRPDIAGNVASGGGNVIGDTSGSTGITNGVNNDKVGAPLLGPLASNGGTVQTFALQTGSPALDIAACPTDPITMATLAVDARGVPRPQGTNCDAGSYEAVTGPLSLTVTTNADNVNDLNCAVASCTLRQAVNLANLATGTGTNTITFDPTVFATPQTITLTGELDLNAAMTITGPGANLLTVSAPGNAFVLNQQSGNVANAVTASGMTVSAGNIDFSVYTARVLTVTDSTLIGNGQDGIYNQGDTVTVTNSTFSGHSIGIENYHTMIVTNSTVSGNTNFGIFNGGTMTVMNSTISGNMYGFVNGSPVTAINTLIVNNTSLDVNGSLSMTSKNNLTGSFTFADASNTPVLHGGTTPTLALPPGSPAIGAGACGVSYTDPITMMSVAVTKDQRGVTLPTTTGCDIGAFQDQGFTFSMPTGNNQTAAKNAPFGMPLGLTISGTNGDPVTNGTVTFTITPGTTGASATFPMAGSCTLSMSNTVAVCPIAGTGTSGTATSPALTANGTPGRFTVIASTAGVPTAGNLTYTLAIPTNVTSITRTTPGASLTNAAAVTYTVTFADPLTGLTAGDFTLTTTGSISGASVGMVSGSGTTWTVTVSTGTGDGTLRLDFTGTANDTNPPAPAFTSGEVYTIDKTAPTVASMPAPLPAATAGQAYGPVTFTAADANTPVITGAMGLPASFTFTPGSGATANTATLTGTPTSTTTISFTVQAQDALGNTTNQPYTITVAKAATTTSVTASPSSVPQGGSVTLTATIAGSGTGLPLPTGSVVFTSGSTMLGTGMLDGTGKASVTTTALPVGMDAITASYGGDAIYAASTGMGSATVTGAAVTGLTVTAPTGSGSGNSGTASMPKLAPGQSLTLTVTGSYTNGTMGSVSGVTFMSSDPMKVTVDASGKLTAIAPGSVTITVTAPNGVTTTITVTVATVPTGGLTNPNPQPMTRATAIATAAATPAPQPTSHPTGGSGVQPQAAGSTPTATPTPAPQPSRH